MLGYYFELAIRSLRRNVVLTTLVVMAIGVGIGVCMTAVNTLRVMSGDPIPDKSSRLFVPTIDAWDPVRGKPGTADSQFSYRDAMALMKAHRALRQAAMYELVVKVSPPGQKRFEAHGRATFADFFAMFEVPFRSGAAWGEKQDAAHENVIVLSAGLADRLFPRVDAVGQAVTLGGRDYRVVGVLRPWTPTPRFYDLLELDSVAWTYAYGDSEDFFLPLSTAIDRQIPPHGLTSCAGDDRMGADWPAHLNSGCYWLQFWAELPTAAQVRDFEAFVRSYAMQQQQLGVYRYAPRVRLLDVRQWLLFNHVIPDSVQVNAIIATALLVVCLVNASGLLLARFAGRAPESAVRRALGASMWDLFLQYFAETVIIGLLSAVLGLLLSTAGLWVVRSLRGVASRDSAMGHLYSVDTRMALIILAATVTATVLTGLYPTLRAVRTLPAWQLKSQ